MSKTQSDWVEIEAIPSMTLEAFAKLNGLTLTIVERDLPKNSPLRYYAHFKDAEEAGDGVLVGTYGDGATHEAAATDYAIRISLKRLVLHAYDTKRRREIKVPRLLPVKAFPVHSTEPRALSHDR